MLGCQLVENGKLSIIGVLELINQDIAELFGISLSDLWISIENDEGVKQHVVEIHCVGLMATVEIFGVYFTCKWNMVEIIASVSITVFEIFLRSDQHILSLRYTGCQQLGLISLVVKLTTFYNRLKQ